MCDPSEAIFDPACRTARRTHAEVAYNGAANSGADCAAGGACGYGVYRAAACRGWVTALAVMPQRMALARSPEPHSRTWLGRPHRCAERGPYVCHMCMVCAMHMSYVPGAGCEFMPLWNAWKCKSKESGGVTPARLIVESMDADHTSRSLTPVALASGGYVDLLNGGWDH